MKSPPASIDISCPERSVTYEMLVLTGPLAISSTGSYGGGAAMYTAGLVVTLTQERAIMQQTLERLRAAGPLTLGAPYEQFVPLALEVEGPSHARRWHEWVASLDGVHGVEVVFVHWDEPGREGEDVRN